MLKNKNIYFTLDGRYREFKKLVKGETSFFVLCD